VEAYVRPEFGEPTYERDLSRQRTAGYPEDDVADIREREKAAESLAIFNKNNTAGLTLDTELNFVDARSPEFDVRSPKVAAGRADNRDEEVGNRWTFPWTRTCARVTPGAT
jgi:hypothetical protein